MQVLKEEVRNKILVAAEKNFYEKDYRSAKLTDIAKDAGIPVALIYTYFKNKEDLFDAIVDSVYVNFSKALSGEEALDVDMKASEKFEKASEPFLNQLLKNHKPFVILVDKSAGTKHCNAKQELIKQLENHIMMALNKKIEEVYDPMLAHLLATYFTEGLIEIARHYQGEEWARKILKLMAKCYFNGVDSL